MATAEEVGRKIYLEAFALWENTSGEEATPTSPFPADIASELRIKNGKAVEIDFSSWQKRGVFANRNTQRKQNNRVQFIL